MKKLSHIVYILKCADGSLYVGCTNDLARRLHEHNHSPRGARYTKQRRPVVLIYGEKFSTLRAARRREHEIKTWPRAKKLKLVKSAQA